MRSTHRNKIMYNTLTFPLTLAIALTSATVFATEGERTITFQEDVSAAQLIRLEVSAGEVEVIGIPGNNLTAVVTGSCQKEKQESCQKLLKELSWSTKAGKITELGLSPSTIDDYDHATIKVKIGVPKDKKLEVNLSAGKLHISGTSACVTAQVNAGELHITLEKSQLDSAELSAKVGDVKLVTSTETTQGERSLLVGANLVWDEGTGSCRAKATVLAGEAQLKLN